MRRVNAYLALTILLLLAIHAVTGTFKLVGMSSAVSAVLKALSYLMAALISIHAVIGVKLMVDTARARRRSGAGYWRENATFHVRRISGLAILLLAGYHAILFMGRQGVGYRLNDFGGVQLAASILLVLALVIHVATNIRPLMIALGATRARHFLMDVLLVLSILMLVCAIAFIVYYLRWNVLWR